jgi:hypothetical protein
VLGGTIKAVSYIFKNFAGRYNLRDRKCVVITTSGFLVGACKPYATERRPDDVPSPWNYSKAAKSQTYLVFIRHVNP